MSEEIRKNEALSDAAMENVSGGGVDPGAAESAAKYVCSQCELRNTSRCKGSADQFAAYMVKKNVYIYVHAECPFYKLSV